MHHGGRYRTAMNPASTTEQAAFFNLLEAVAAVAPEIARPIVQELIDQSSNLKMIASENYSSLAVQFAMANLLTDKYAEGYVEYEDDVKPRRFYAGCENVDNIEAQASRWACELFGAEHAYVQPHSGADANLIAFWSILGARVEEPKLGKTNPETLDHAAWEEIRQQLCNQRILGPDLYSGGHLTHGFRRNVSAKMFDAHSYSVKRETGLLDYDDIAARAKEVKPLILIAGYSAYPRKLNFAKMRQIADDVGAVLMVDMAHFAGLVAGKVFTGDYDPVPHAHVVTSTTHKTLRGPRGGIVLTTKEFADHVNKGCPMVAGGPLPHVMAAKGVCFREALRPEFRDYAAQVVKNAQALSESLEKRSARVLTGGTENHLVLIDLTERGYTGRQAEEAFRECSVTLNRNTIPFDQNGAWYTSGLRAGTAALTTAGMKEAEMDEVAAVYATILDNIDAKPGSKAKYVWKNDGAADEARGAVKRLMDRFPPYPALDLNALKARFIES